MLKLNRTTLAAIAPAIAESVNGYTYDSFTLQVTESQIVPGASNLNIELGGDEAFLSITFEDCDSVKVNKTDVGEYLHRDLNANESDFAGTILGFWIRMTESGGLQTFFAPNTNANTFVRGCRFLRIECGNVIDGSFAWDFSLAPTISTNH